MEPGQYMDTQNKNETNAVENGFSEQDEYIPAHLKGVKEHHTMRLQGLAASTLSQQTGYRSPVRGLAVGLFGVVVLSFATPFADSYLQASGLAATYLPTGVFLLFLLILGINAFLKASGAPMKRDEIMLAYMTMLVPSAIPASGLALRLVPLLVEAYYYATPVNEWAILHHNHIPHWMTPHGTDVVNWFFEGLPEGESVPWLAWIKPLALWGVLAFALYMIMTSLSLVLRKRWMGAERLQFPLAQIPLTVMGNDDTPSWRSRFFRQPLLYVGFAVPFIIHTLNGLHVYFPAIPGVELTSLKLSSLLAGSTMLDPPFSSLGDIEFNFYWSITGISYLLRSEVSLSVWAFEMFTNVEQIAFDISGIGDGQHKWSPLHTFGYALMSRYQKLGAITVAAGMFFWASRGELREMVMAALGKSHRRRDDDYRIPQWTLWSLVIGLCIYIGWTLSTGMNLVAALVLLASFLLVAVVTARIVGATGLLWVYDFYVNMHGLAKVMGTARLDPHTFTNAGMIDFSVLNVRANIMPMTLDSAKIVQQTGVKQRHFFIGMVLGLILAMIVSFATVIWLGYHFGGANLEEFAYRGGGRWLFDRVGGFQLHRVFTDWTVLGIMAAGGAFMAFLFHMHRTYLWWAINPLGFIIGDTVASRQMWFPVLLGWLLKLLILRFAGANGYNKNKAIAMGFIIGEFVSVGIWLVIDAITGTTLHKVFPMWVPK